jgi:hypothetical protein
MQGLPGLWAGDRFRPHTWGNCLQLPYIRKNWKALTSRGGILTGDAIGV